MKVLRLDDIHQNEVMKREVVRMMRKGAVFVYPTDTVYGIGCNAEKTASVARVRELKRAGNPLSVIAPSKKWIKYKLQVTNNEYLKKLPGPYTLIFKKKRPSLLREASSTDALGVRIPDHPFTRLVADAAVPFITTSANEKGMPPIMALSHMTPKFLKFVDYAIDGGIISGQPSRVVDLTGEEPVVLRE